MSESAETAKNAPEGGQSVKKLFFHKITMKLLLFLGAAFLLGLSGFISDTVKEWLFRFSWELPIEVIFGVSASLIVLCLMIPFAGERIVKKMSKRKKEVEKSLPAREPIKKTLPKIVRGAGELGVLGCAFAVITLIVVRSVPFEKMVVLDNNKAVNESIPLIKDISGMELRIECDPVKEESGSVSFELRRKAPNADDEEVLDIGGLTRNDSIEEGKYYFPKLGSFKLPGPFWVGDTLKLNTINGSGFNGKINFKFREVSPAKNPLEFEGNIIFEPKKKEVETGTEPGNGAGSIADYEGKIMLKSRETLMEGGKE
jgi:hypothetical protein